MILGFTHLEIIVLIICGIFIIGMFVSVKRGEKKREMEDEISEQYRHSHLQGKFPGKSMGD